MDSRAKIIFLSFAVVNWYYINNLKTIAPCRYVKQDGYVYVTL